MNRGDLLYDLQEATRQLAKALTADDTPVRSVTNKIRVHVNQRRLSNRLTDDQVRELVAAFEAGATRMELAERYSIGRSSVAKLLRAWREEQAQEGAT